MSTMPVIAVVDEVVMAVDRGRREWLQAADIIVATHRWRGRASRWSRRTRDQYPGCVMAVATHPGGRWCLIRLPDRVVLVRGRGLPVAAVAQAAYAVWLGGRHDARRGRTNPLGG
jgi:hypothetical protein